MQRITSRENPLIKQLVLLMENKKERTKTGLFIAEGLRLCREAAQSSIAIKTVLVTDAFMDKHGEQASTIFASCDDVVMISEGVSQKLGDTVSSQGIFCLCQLPDTLCEIQGKKFIVLENLQDPGNIGTIIRSAQAFKMDGVVFVGNCVDIYSPKVLRSTMGTVFSTPIYRFPSMLEAKQELKKVGCEILGAVLDDKSEKLSQIKFKDPCAVIIGNEANGLSDLAKSCCDSFVYIEMSGNAESLNAAVAASVIMWEMQK